jgi:DNA-binding MarR family transcriptional regulator
VSDLIDRTRPLSALLSHALVAFTIEFDNEFEHQMPHHINATPRSVARGPWLVSQVMWSNVMQFLTPAGITVGDLHAVARTTHDSLAGLQRWSYVVVEPDPGDSRAKPRRNEAVVRPTASGTAAQDVWRPLAGVIEARWRERFGVTAFESLRESLVAVVDKLDVDLPRYLPIVYPTMNGKADVPTPKASTEAAGPQPTADLSVLLSQVLLAFTIDFEQVSRISLPISANTLRVLDAAGVRVRDLPRLTGVSKEANSMSTGFLARHGCVVVEPDPTASRGKVVRLTAKGLKAQAKFRRVLHDTEDMWWQRFGGRDMTWLRDSLEAVVGEGPLAQTRMSEGLAPYADGWRAAVRRPETLPDYPMVLHRGGYPDGS